MVQEYKEIPPEPIQLVVNYKKITKQREDTEKCKVENSKAIAKHIKEKKRKKQKRKKEHVAEKDQDLLDRELKRSKIE